MMRVNIDRLKRHQIVARCRCCLRQQFQIWGILHFSHEDIDTTPHTQRRSQTLTIAKMVDDDQHQAFNILLTTFAGLGLPRTLSLPTGPNTTVRDALDSISSHLPPTSHPLTITTNSSIPLDSTSSSPLSTLLPGDHADFLPLRLSTPTCGGKGGFGAQLRAAGGRMSSRKKNDAANANPNGSNRNLDGRRLRTVDEAKRLAEYLAIKPEMEKKEKEERRKRWEAVVEASEKREEEIRRGGAGGSGGRLDGDWVEAKEGAEERVRESVMKAMREMDVERTGSESEADGAGGASEDEDGAGEGSSGSSEDVKEEGGRTFFGWDDEEDDSEEEEEEQKSAPVATEAEPTFEGKGKGKAKA